MPSPPITWPVRIHFTTRGKKPSAARLPGLDTWGIVCGRIDRPGTKPVRLWKFSLDDLLAN